jgi:hypothetical protein
MILRMALGNRHQCRLGKKDARAMKLPIGRLCDVCEEEISVYMKMISSSDNKLSPKESPR